MRDADPPTTPDSRFRQPRWTWFDVVLLGPNWGPRTPLKWLLLVIGLFIVSTIPLSWLRNSPAGPQGLVEALFAWCFLALACPPIAWAIFRGMVRGHYRAMVRADEKGRCAFCEYDALPAHSPRCPECGRSLNHSRFVARWWLSRL